MTEETFKSINIIDTLAEQIECLLDLMQGADSGTDTKTFNCAAEMTVTTFEELMAEVEKLERALREKEA